MVNFARISGISFRERQHLVTEPRIDCDYEALD